MKLLLIQLEEYMLPCMWKKTFNIECMGCGIQRSVALLFKGQFIDAFFMYPAVYTIIGLFGFIIVNHFKKFKFGNKIIAILALSNVIIIISNFLIKLYLK